MGFKFNIWQTLHLILARLTSLEEHVMALADDLKAGIKKLDDETTVIAGLIKTLEARITNGMSDQEVADVKASLGTLSDRLTSLGVDPNNPVPPSPPALQALKTK